MTSPEMQLNIGEVRMLVLDKTNGITPKDGEKNRNKFFVVWGFDKNENIIGGVVINSKINNKHP